MSDLNAGRTRSRMMLLGIVMVFAAPLLVAWLVFNFTDYGRGGTVGSYGQLIQPARQLANLDLYDPVSGAYSGHLYGEWTLLAVSGPECAQKCADNLYRMQQIRLAMGENDHRVQRLLVVYGKDLETLSVPLRESYPGQLYVDGAVLDPADPGKSLKLVPGEDLVAAGRLYLVDPLGNLIMSYAPDALPGGIIKDLKRLLRYSHIG